MRSKLTFYNVLFIFITSCTVATKAQNNCNNPSKLFEQYKNDKDKSVTLNFSYVGYHYGNVAAPAIINSKIFNVTDYSAIADDTLSDKAAIQKAINAANKNGSGIAFFPKGRFLANEDVGSLESFGRTTFSTISLYIIVQIVMLIINIV